MDPCLIHVVPYILFVFDGQALGSHGGKTLFT
jgi:hypothetical protein